MNTKVKRYRCGWCGQPADKDGVPIPYETLRSHPPSDWQNASQVNGTCCPGGDESLTRGYVTREMAMDAGNLSLEGMPL